MKDSILIEILSYLKHKKKYWLMPIIIVLVLLGAIVIFTETSALAPFIYALF